MHRGDGGRKGKASYQSQMLAIWGPDPGRTAGLLGSPFLGQPSEQADGARKGAFWGDINGKNGITLLSPRRLDWWEEGGASMKCLDKAPGDWATMEDGG